MRVGCRRRTPSRTWPGRRRRIRAPQMLAAMMAAQTDPQPVAATTATQPLFEAGWLVLDQTGRPQEPRPRRRLVAYEAGEEVPSGRRR
jgi:hypothetical protein